MAAAGQIFFTSVGMGPPIVMQHIDAKELNAVSTGFMNEFVEVVLGSLIVILLLQDIWVWTG
jgi:SNF family Na+-dependent transporter